MSKKLLLSVFELASVVVTAVAAIAVIFIFGRLTTVDGKSMEPTLHDGDRLIVCTAMSEYEYKDIVVVVEPNEELFKPIIKRVIATEGQWVDVNYSEGAVYVGNTKETMMPLEESYTASLTNSKSGDDMHQYPIQVPSGHLFVMGDNRNHSTDSRSCLVGFVDENYVMGKAFFRLMPFGEFDIYGSE